MENKTKAKIKIYKDAEIEIIKEGCLILSELLGDLLSKVDIGMPTKEIDIIFRSLCERKKVVPAFLNYNGYPSSVCVSVNNIIVHGIPDNYKLKNSDVVSIDCGIKYKGFYADMAFTMIMGEASPQALSLVKTTYIALLLGISEAKPGKKTGDIGHTIESYALQHGFSVAEGLTGHGIGKELHEFPEIPNWGPPNCGPTLQKGMVICIEPMLTCGSGKTITLPDKWSVSSIDGSISAHFEHTILITDSNAIPLTTYSFIPENIRKVIMD